MAITLGSNSITSDTNRIDLGRVSTYGRSIIGTFEGGTNDGFGGSATNLITFRLGVSQFNNRIASDFARSASGRTTITGVNVANDYLICPQLTNNAFYVHLFVGGSVSVSGGTVPAKYFYGQLVGFFTWDASGVCTQRLVAVNDVRATAATDFTISTVFTAGSTTASRVRFQIISNALYVRFVSAGAGAASDVSTMEYRALAVDTLESFANYNTALNNIGNTPFPTAMVAGNVGHGQGVQN